jgi:hypothetical protein
MRGFSMPFSLGAKKALLLMFAVSFLSHPDPLSAKDPRGPSNEPTVAVAAAGCEVTLNGDPILMAVTHWGAATCRNSIFPAREFLLWPMGTWAISFADPEGPLEEICGTEMLLVAILRNEGWEARLYYPFFSDYRDASSSRRAWSWTGPEFSIQPGLAKEPMYLLVQIPLDQGPDKVLGDHADELVLQLMPRGSKKPVLTTVMALNDSETKTTSEIHLVSCHSYPPPSQAPGMHPLIKR